MVHEQPEPSDILVKLYELPALDLSPMDAAGVTIRRPTAPERHIVLDWISGHFTPGWVSEMETALGNRPASCFIAIEGQGMVGFACYDATARGLFGPTGVAESARGRGIGAALLVVSLHAMRDQGYAYAVIGAAGPVDFYLRLVGGLLIPGSWPGLYRGSLEERDVP